MGAGQSSGTDVGGSTMGYQVLRVYPNSPGSRAGLKAYFDFIVAIGNTRFNRENGSLREILKASVDQKLKMVVYNTRTKKIRETEIVPSTNWGGNGLLGVSIKHSSFDRADERVWHVIEVEPGSPSQQAGFQARADYVIGSDSILQENDDLYNLIEAHEGKALKLFVYNTKTDNCREVICHPNSRWGGKGLLGCEFGHGLLHRIPYMGGDENPNEDPRASLLRYEEKPGEVNTSGPDVSSPSQFTAPNPMMQQFQQGPGHQLLQQALSDRPPQQQQPAPLDKVLPTPPPVPQTFAQLASAQFQSQQYQSQPQPSSPQVSNPNTSYPQSVTSANNATQQTLPQSQAPSNLWSPSYQPQQSPMYQQQVQALQQLDNTGLLQQQATSAEKALPPMPPASQTFAQFAAPQYQSPPYQPPVQPPNPHPKSPPNANYSQDLGPPPAAPQQMPPHAQTSPNIRPPAYPMQQQPYLFQQQLQTLQHPEVGHQHQHQQQQQHQQHQQVQPQQLQLHEQQQQQQPQVQQPRTDFPYPPHSVDSSNQ